MLFMNFSSLEKPGALGQSGTLQTFSQTEPRQFELKVMAPPRHNTGAPSGCVLTLYTHQ